MAQVIYLGHVPRRTVAQAIQRITLDAFRRGWDPAPWTRYVVVLADELGDAGEAERRVLTAMARGEEPPVYARSPSPDPTSRVEEAERRKPKH